MARTGVGNLFNEQIIPNELHDKRRGNQLVAKLKNLLKILEKSEILKERTI